LDVLYHRGVDVPKAIGEFNRVLKKNGFLYIQEPAYQWLFSRHDRTIETQRRFDKSNLESLLKKSQFKVLQCSYYNMLLLPLIIFKRLRDRFTLGTQSDVYNLPPFFNSIMFKVMNFESEILKKLNLPFGLSIIVLCQK